MVLFGLSSSRPVRAKKEDWVVCLQHYLVAIEAPSDMCDDPRVSHVDKDDPDWQIDYSR